MQRIGGVAVTAPTDSDVLLAEIDRVLHGTFIGLDVWIDVLQRARDRIAADAESAQIALNMERETHKIELAAVEDRAPDAKRYRWLRDCLWWRTDPFSQDVGNMRQGYFQTKLFKRPEGPINIDAFLDAQIAADAALAQPEPEGKDD